MWISRIKYSCVSYYRLLIVSVFAFSISGCATPEQNIGLSALGISLIAGNSPSSEIEQIYYLGVFDERNQLPPEFYRIKVHGQASLTSQMKFGSGWVLASAVDTLGTSELTLDQADPKAGAKLSETPKKAGAVCTESDSHFLEGRKLVLYGPEGFRKVPKCHRLALVMGADPSAFFEAIDTSLGVFNEVAHKERHQEIQIKLLKRQLQLQAELTRLEDLEDSL